MANGLKEKDNKPSQSGVKKTEIETAGRSESKSNEKVNEKMKAEAEKPVKSPQPGKAQLKIALPEERKEEPKINEPSAGTPKSSFKLVVETAAEIPVHTLTPFQQQQQA